LFARNLIYSTVNQTLYKPKFWKRETLTAGKAKVCAKFVAEQGWGPNLWLSKALCQADSLTKPSAQTSGLSKALFQADSLTKPDAKTF
jgi:hypothetical protein